MNLIEHMNKLVDYDYNTERSDFMSTHDIEDTDYHTNHPEEAFLEEKKDHIFHSLCQVQKFINSDFVTDFKTLIENLDLDIEGDFQEVDKRFYILFQDKYKNLI